MQRLLRKFRTIGGITKPITRIVTQLQEHEAYHSERATKHHVKAALHASHANSAIDEAKEASATAAKFSQLF